MARNKVNNCLKHFKDKDECSECSENHVLDNNQCLSIKGDPAQVPINKGYIQSCLPMGDCDSQIKYEGLPLHLSSTVSCHKCSSTSKIPFVGLRVDDDFKAVSLQEYSFA
ncbi:MAG: hypothetical protein DHS20C13_26550 [Thermodesulfobacteriota bacterium]|nr:MAG: hypothetical protein DHS20C13_26550 [Thermodesulfobacteriota bacterium]